MIRLAAMALMGMLVLASCGADGPPLRPGTEAPL
jgi:predicted small lipoprotein YifL